MYILVHVYVKLENVVDKHIHTSSQLGCSRYVVRVCIIIHVLMNDVALMC